MLNLSSIARLASRGIRPSLQHRPISSTQPAYFFQNLKENLKQEREKDDKLKKARQQLDQSLNQTSDEFQPALDKMKKIQQDSQSVLDKKREEFLKMKENIASNERFQQAGERFAKSGLKFKIPKIPSMDSKQFDDIKETAQTADMIGTTIFGWLDKDPAYKRPINGPRKRKPDWLEQDFEADDDTTTVTSHRDNMFTEQVDKLKDSKVGQRFSNFRSAVEDSDNALLRAGKLLYWKAKDQFALNAETSHVVGTIKNLDPKFSIADFCELLQDDILPNILEAAIIGDEECIDDWCTEKASAVLMANKKIAATQGLSYQRHIYSLTSVEFVDASMDDETDTPTIMISCETQEVVAVINSDGDVVDGSKEAPIRNNIIWVFARDMMELESKAAWKCIEVQSSARPMTY